MTHSQWIYYFAAELVSAAPHMAFTQAVALARLSAHREAPEIVARALATLIAPAPLTRSATRRARSKRLASVVLLH
jgi:hypothetical protein